jgi:signal transduction histidine kinase
MAEAEAGHGGWAAGEDVTTRLLEPRLRALLRATLEVASQPSLEAMLDATVRAAASLTGARYAALGVRTPSGETLERFVTTGLDAKERAHIGSEPQGRGILGVLLRERRTLRLQDISDDPRAVGFPPGHPPMRSFLGVPILIQGVLYGSLYLTEKAAGAEFDDDDAMVVESLAGHAGAVIQLTRLYERSTRWFRQLEDIVAVANELGAETDRERLARIVAERGSTLLDARIVVVALRWGDGTLVAEAATGPGAEALVGTLVPDAGFARLVARGSPERVDDVLEDPEIDRQELAWLAAASGASPRSVLHVPLVSHGTQFGVLSAYDNLRRTDARFSEADLRLATVLGQRLSSALDLARRVSRETLQRLVDANEAERGRISRELHDETAQALGAIKLGLAGLAGAAPDDLDERVRALRALVGEALDRVREVAVRLRPASLDDFGLHHALDDYCKRITARSGVAVSFDGSDARLPAPIEDALYRVALEAIGNALAHGEPRQVLVRLLVTPAAATVRVDDDGHGFELERARERGRLGLIGMHERMELVGGTLQVDTTPGGGTRLRAQVPLSRDDGAAPI